jgi:hypothetical protein
MAMLLRDDARKLFSMLYFTMNGLFESIVRYRLDVLKYASISLMVPEKQDTELACDLVHFPEIECYSAQVEVRRHIAEIRFTSRGGRYGHKHDV